MAYIRGCNLKIFCLCQSTKQTAVGNGAKPAKFIQPKRKRKRKDAPFMRPDTGKRPRKPKRNREFPKNYPKFPIFVASFTVSYRPQRYLTAPAASVRPGFSI